MKANSDNAPDNAPGKASAMGRGVGGRQKLIEAALHLASSTHSLASLGLRERRLRRRSRSGPAQVRAADRGVTQDPNQVIHLGREIVNQSVALVLEFVTEHRVAYIVGIRELHGSSPAMRAALQRLMDEFAADMAEDVQTVLRLPGLDAATLLEISRQVIRQMTFFSMDYLEHPAQREAIRDQAERFIMRLFAGELAIQASGQLAGAGGKRRR